MAKSEESREVLEVEVERLPLSEEGGAGPARAPGPGEAARRAHRALGPVLAGVLVDVVDAATVTPLLGLALGLPAGYYLARQLGLERGSSLRMAAIVALYCGVPGTLGLPLGTLTGAYVRLRQAFGSEG